MSKAEKTRAYIIEKTAPLFNTKGYAGTSLYDMMEVTGLSKGSIYGNFANKDEVALAVFEYNYRKVFAIIREEMAKRKSIKDKLLVYTHVYKNYMDYPFPIGGCPILNTAIEADDTHERLKALTAQAIISWKDTIIDLLEQGIQSGELKHVPDPEQIALGIIASIEGGIMIARITGNLNYKSSIISAIETLLNNLE